MITYLFFNIIKIMSDNIDDLINDLYGLIYKIEEMLDECIIDDIYYLYGSLINNNFLENNFGIAISEGLNNEIEFIKIDSMINKYLIYYNGAWLIIQFTSSYSFRNEWITTFYIHISYNNEEEAINYFNEN